MKYPLSFLLVVSMLNNFLFATIDPTTGTGTVNGYSIGPGVDLRSSDLAGTNLTGADLTGADLRSANLALANLTDAFISSATQLSGADLSGADLSGVDLSGVDLSGVVWTNIQSQEAYDAVLDEIKLKYTQEEYDARYTQEQYDANYSQGNTLGYSEGQSDVTSSPGSYDLYTSSEFDSNYSSGYEAGTLVGASEVTFLVDTDAKTISFTGSAVIVPSSDNGVSSIYSLESGTDSSGGTVLDISAGLDGYPEDLNGTQVILTVSNDSINFSIGTANDNGSYKLTGNGVEVSYASLDAGKQAQIESLSIFGSNEVASVGSPSEIKRIYTDSEYTNSYDLGVLAGRTDVLDNPNDYSLFTASDMITLAGGNPVLSKGSEGSYQLVFAVLESSDLEDFTNKDLIGLTPTVNTNAEIELPFTSSSDVAFYRLQIAAD
tara:strand:- start:5885 stop:7183 length:1299 start_codon:yes stop_codon:yes gene_type:complete